MSKTDNVRSKLTGSRIRKLRYEKDMTQAALAERISVPRSYISYWEKGRRMPDKHSIELMSRLFGVPADFILGLSDKKYNIKIPEMLELDLTKLNTKGVEALHEYYKLLLCSEKYRR